MQQYTVLLISVLLACNCLNPLPTEESGRYFLLKAFLIDGESVKNIAVKEIAYYTIFQNSVNTATIKEKHVPSASIQLDVNGQTYSLQRDPANIDSTFFCDYVVRQGDVCAVSVTVYDEQSHVLKQLSSSTVIPPRCSPLILNADTLWLDATLQDKYLQVYSNPLLYPHLSLTINSNSDAYHIVRCNRLSPNDSAIFTNVFDPLPSKPFKGNSCYLSPLNVAHYGSFNVVVYHINKEYADLYLDQHQKDGWTIPKTQLYQSSQSNVTNGTGIFTGVSSDTTFLVVAKRF